MAGNLVPLVMLPRFSTYAGATSFKTIAMDVTAYQSAILNVWRGPGVGTSPTMAIAFEESTDQVDWSTCATTPDPTSTPPAANTEVQYVADLKKRWYRVVVTLGGTAPVVTSWAVGFLEERQN